MRCKTTHSQTSSVALSNEASKAALFVMRKSSGWRSQAGRSNYNAQHNSKRMLEHEATCFSSFCQPTEGLQANRLRQVLGNRPSVTASKFGGSPTTGYKFWQALIKLLAF